MTRGVRNNNPANIRHGQKWQGLACVQEDKDFCTFKTMFYGVRAMVITLRTYILIYGLNDISKILYRWAPPQDGNDTVGYIKEVRKHFFLLPSFSVDDFTGEGSENLYTLCKAMCKVESGYFLPEYQFHEVCRKLHQAQ